jgi:adenylyltransferase/sulfurtransferase
MPLSDDQRRRYARNISLAGVGEAGQEKLLRARVLVVGAGGLGSAALAYLAAAGVGHIGIADFDRVELSNLQRQIIHEHNDIGRFKAHSARDRIEELNPNVKVTTHEEKLTAANASSVIKSYDIVSDGCDNFATRFAVNEACHAQRKTLVSAAIRAYDGQLAVFKSDGITQPCYRCFASGRPDDERGCADVGVIGAIAGIMGSLQALEVIKEILCIGESLAGQILLLDSLTLKTRIVRIARDPDCACCGAKRKQVASSDQSR